MSLKASGHLRVSMLSVDIGTSFSLAISHSCTCGGVLEGGINVANRWKWKDWSGWIGMFCSTFEGGVRRWLDWVQGVKCLSLVTIGGLAFLHQNGPSGWPSNGTWTDPPTPNHPTRHAIVASKTRVRVTVFTRAFPWGQSQVRLISGGRPRRLPTPYRGIHCEHKLIMSFPGRSIQPHIRQPSMAAGTASSAGQSPALVARVNEKKAELENLRELRDLSAAVASQMEALEQKLATLSDGTEGMVDSFTLSPCIGQGLGQRRRKRRPKV